MLVGDVILHDWVLESKLNQLLQCQLIVPGHVAVANFLQGEIISVAREDVPEVAHATVAPVGEEELAYA